MWRFWRWIEASWYYLLCSYRVWRLKRLREDDVVYVTERNVEIRVYPGKKRQSPHDFIVRFKQPHKRERTPRHVHLIVEMYVKHAYNPSLTLQLRDHILEMFQHIQPVDSFPPSLQFFKREHVEPFRQLDNVGEFTVEFLLVVTELVGIQEKTNYPEGSLTESLYRNFGVADRFAVIQKATWRGR
ncbi:MAG: hypothetical protein RMM06_05975 [Armatimonadota bacterium]|nr:hypothetical protein [Armatimonadota bacterium]MDW8290251.1 hypothetical protein [Armatimonadota bacterium]